MSRPFAAALLLASCLAAALPALAQSVPAAAAPGDSAEDTTLKALFAASDEASLQRNPVNALFRGDLRYADRLGDPFSDSYIAAERAAAQSDLAALARIDRAKLTRTDQIAYDVFKQQSSVNLRGLRPISSPSTSSARSTISTVCRPSIPSSPLGRARHLSTPSPTMTII